MSFIAPALVNHPGIAAIYEASAMSDVGINDDFIRKVKERVTWRFAQM